MRLQIDESQSCVKSVNDVTLSKSYVRHRIA